jgi:chromosomal replication initiator protein
MVLANHKGQPMIAKRPIQLHEITLATCFEFGISEKELRGKRQTKNRATARHCAMYLIHKLMDLSYTEIGEEFKKRDHSSVMYGVKKISEAIKADVIFKHRLDRIMCQLYLGHWPQDQSPSRER